MPNDSLAEYAIVPPGLPEIEIAEPVLAEALDHWNRIRRPGPIPQRTALDPVDIPKLLPHSELIDVIDGGADFRYRLLGSDIVLVSRQNYTGLRVSEIPDQRPPSVISSLYRACVNERRPISVALPYVGTVAEVARIAALVLPLADRDGAISVLWGLVVATAPDGRHAVPRRPL